jgi:hypothetical protein
LRADTRKEFGCNGLSVFYNARVAQGARTVRRQARQVGDPPRTGGWQGEIAILDLRRARIVEAGLVGGALVLLGAGVAFWIGLGSAPQAVAAVASSPGIGPAGSVVVSATSMPDNRVVICLLDASRDRLLIYLADASRSRLRLLAVRDISADWALSDYNNDAPLPKDIRARVEKGGAVDAGPGAGAKSPESAP